MKMDEPEACAMPEYKRDGVPTAERNKVYPGHEGKHAAYQQHGATSRKVGASSLQISASNTEFGANLNPKGV